MIISYHYGLLSQDTYVHKLALLLFNESISISSCNATNLRGKLIFVSFRITTCGHDNSKYGECSSRVFHDLLGSASPVIGESSCYMVLIVTERNRELL